MTIKFDRLNDGTIYVSLAALDAPGMSIKVTIPLTGEGGARVKKGVEDYTPGVF